VYVAYFIPLFQFLHLKKMVFFEALCGIIVLLFLFYYYLIANYNFWKNRAIIGPDPVSFFGTLKELILKREFSGIYWKRLYDAYECSSFIGLFRSREPILMIKDPKHIKDVLITDGSVFSKRGMPLHVNVYSRNNW